MTQRTDFDARSSADAVAERPLVAIFDLDGTLVRGDTYLAFLIQFWRSHPARWWRGPFLASYVGAYGLKLRGNTWLKTSFLRDVLAGTSRDELADFAQRFIDRWVEPRLQPGGLAELQKCRGEAAKICIASASFDFYVQRIAARLGVEHVVCTRSAWDDRDRLRAELPEGNCHGQGKLNLVQAWLGPQRSHVRVCAYSDDSSDLPLLRWADSAVAVNPRAKLRQAAAEHGIAIRDWSGS